jgi:hypothetical protein
MSLRGKSCRLAVLVSAAALVPTFSTGQDTDPEPTTIFVGGPAALDVSRAVRDAVGRGCRNPGARGSWTTSRTARAGPCGRAWGPPPRRRTSPGSSSARARSPADLADVPPPGRRPSPRAAPRSSSAGRASGRSRGVLVRTRSSTRCSTPSACARTRRAPPRSPGGWPSAAAADLRPGISRARGVGRFFYSRAARSNGFA